jgi:hypothetical protein
MSRVARQSHPNLPRKSLNMSAAGTWNMTIDTPIGKQKARLELSQTADGAWEGTSQSTESGETSALSDIKVDGDNVEWHQAVTKPMKLNLKVTVTIDGDKLSGKAKAGMFPAVSMTGERATES